MTATAFPGRVASGESGRPHPEGPSTVLLKNVYYMLAYAFTALETGEHRRLAAEDFDHVHDLLAAVLAEGLDNQRRRGFERDYEPFTEDLALVRGRIDPAATMRLQARCRGLVRCGYDERTDNTLMNRLLKTAALRLILHGRITPARRTRLKSTLLVMGGVELMSVGELERLRWETLRFHRGNRSYRLLMGVCRLVLDQRLLSDDDGAVSLADLLDPQELSALYERFVLAYFRRHHPRLRAGAPWVSGGIEDAPVFLPGLHTDIVLTGATRTLIIDTKCYGRILGSRFDRQILSPANRNQIYSYVMHETSDPRQSGREVEGMLLYAQTTVDPPIRETWTENGHRFHVRTLDLDRDFTEIAAQLDDVAALLLPA
ncbi:5-methylcytosine restriction system specificity protein McrC [Actinomyces viscosus]|uniref:5-methylcytosine-specific restriction enzyme subunit McrC n=1 Tax=Actinomyces viscosus TaxID=1656 RepID=A0A448PH18_ACTVI|nr:restriction endonuclease [Actinomyces viscosus]VEI14259.1 5-methylcytosine-specific restriction enzyme subunit McrC [Actinomyces viscosus]